MDCFKLFKVHNMFAFMLDPWFKDLSLMLKILGWPTLKVEIATTYDS